MYLHLWKIHIHLNIWIPVLWKSSTLICCLISWDFWREKKEKEKKVLTGSVIAETKLPMLFLTVFLKEADWNNINCVQMVGGQNNKMENCLRECYRSGLWFLVKQHLTFIQYIKLLPGSMLHIWLFISGLLRTIKNLWKDETRNKSR